MAQEMSDENLGRIYEEVKRIHKATWQCLEEKAAAHNVTKHSHGMTIYPVEKWVVGGILLGDYKPDNLRGHMKMISPDNCVPFLSSQPGNQNVVIYR